MSSMLCVYVYVSVCDVQARRPHRAPRSWPNEIWVKVVLHSVAVKSLVPQFTAVTTHGIGIEKEEREEEDHGWCEEGNSFWPFKCGLCGMTILGESGSDTGIHNGVHQCIGTLLYKC